MALPKLKLKRLGIDTYQDAIVYMRRDCPVCRSEGFSAQARIEISTANKSIIATLNVVNQGLLAEDEAGLSEAAWNLLGASVGMEVTLSHPKPLASLGHVRAKVYGKKFRDSDFDEIIGDIVAGRYSDIHLSSFITICADNRLDSDEIAGLTKAMIKNGEILDWGSTPIMDKHSVGGLPGNRTTPIIVAIAAAAGLTMPKTSSRAITSPAGTADTMEMLAPVNLDVPAIRKVVEREGGCIVWGGAVGLSPADDLLIRVEKVLDIDSDGQLVASILSKKKAAGSTHVIIDMPVGATAKVRSEEAALNLRTHLTRVALAVRLQVETLLTDGNQPVGHGIGPALEAHDVLAVLQGHPLAPADLRERALTLSGALLELSGKLTAGSGRELAQRLLEDGSAWKKFQGICEAQGGLRTPGLACFSHDVLSPIAGTLTRLDNRRLARLAKFAGAPHDPTAGVKLLKRLGASVEKGEPLLTVYAESSGEMDYALAYAAANPSIILVEPG